MANESKIGLRDERRPGHFWADNEIFDVFGDELGSNGIGLYMAMARFCYGPEVRKSLRELAAAARMSKDTVARSLKVLVRLGLVVETRGGASRTVSTYALTDAKELAREYIRKSVSQRDSDKVREIRQTARNTTLSQLLKAGAEVADNCLTMRQSSDEQEAEDKKICVAESATDLSHTAANLSQNEGPFKYKTQDSKTNTPLPPSSRGELVSTTAEANSRNAVEPEELAAVHLVMRECNLSNPRLEPVVARAIATQRRKTDAPENPMRIAEQMVEMHREFAKSGHLMRFRMGVRKFFSDGLCVDSNLWPWDYGRIEQMRCARVGLRL